ncbi:DUF6622 family protein [Ramlibacter sp.]|uniref:DUF6622 family protein n=1 Tax=Ramlibacter sp. TaxID=1917967 RepID=UPI003D0AB939
MLLQLVVNHPEAIVTIVRNTPVWVWGLLAGLLALGASQLRDRTASLMRVSLLPLGMTVFSAWGTLSALGASPHLANVLAAWLLAAAMAFSLLVPGRAAAQFDAARRTYRLQGSVVPLLLIVGIFMTKYAVGVELAMAPQRVQETQFALGIAALYGAFTGIFVGRAARLWKLALRPATVGLAA